MTKFSRNITHKSWYGTFGTKFVTIAVMFLVVAVGSGALNASENDQKENGRKARQSMDKKTRIPSAPTIINLGGKTTGNSAQRLSVPEEPSLYNQDRLLGAHLLRRAGFGPTFKDLKKVGKGLSARTKWINAQLNPSGISDSGLKLPSIDEDNYDYDYLRAWFIRMVFSKRQLQEKMTLVWHEHFSVSLDKVSEPYFMNQHEALLRKHSLGNFRQFLIDMTKDNSMLRWLDNDYNDGNDEPNENYAREFMQLYSMGTVLMRLDGTPIHENGTDLLPGESPVQPYNEDDVKALARSLAGWHVDYGGNKDCYPKCSPTGIPETWLHNFSAKTYNFAGTGMTAPAGMDSVTELNFVVNQMLNGNPRRTDSIAAFLAKILLSKLATEDPSPAYIQAVATAFRNSGWEIKEAVRAVLTHPEFESPANVRTMFKEPIEQYVGAIRALFGDTDGDGGLIDWANDTGHLIWWPPSVFSFYPPGQKGSLVNSMFVFERDDSAGEFVTGDETFINMKTLMKKGKLTKTYGTAQANLVGPTADYLADILLGAELDANVRTTIINYMLNNNNPGSGEDYVGDGYFDRDIRYALWLMMCSPDFHRN